MKPMHELLQASAALHQHLCPRQVLGVRMGMLASQLLDLELPQSAKRLVTISETDGCAADGIAVATGCRVGRRTLYVFDFGKVAATFVDTATGQAIRIKPGAVCRQRAPDYAPDAQSRWEAYLLGYQRMPEAELLDAQEVTLTLSLQQLLGQKDYRVTCEACGEEIINRREVLHDGIVLCRACAGARYYATGSDLTVRPLVLFQGTASGCSLPEQAVDS